MSATEGDVNAGYTHDEDETLHEVKEKTDDISLQERTGEVISDETKMASLSDDDDDDDPDCGWFQFRPSLIQRCNGPAGYIFIISLFSIAQSTTVNGLVYVVTTTLEKRFNLTSTRSGSISSMYDLSVLAVVIFVTYFGERAHKPILLGTGALIFSAGSFFFTLPHFLTDNYQYEPVTISEGICVINSTSPETCEEGADVDNLSRYFYFFLAAQFLHGLGASPLYTLGQAYVYDNTRARYAPVYIAVFQVAGNLAPAFGYIGGGLLLSLWTDTRVSDEIDIDPSHPLWVGNWWLGFMLTGGLALLVAGPLTAFPKRLPGAKKIELERKRTAQKGSKFEPSGHTIAGKFGDLPRAVLNILKNIPCLMLYFGIGSEFFIIACISVFGPKFLESQFGLSAAEAAIFAGVVVIPSAIGGVLLGGFIIKWFDWSFRGTIRFLVSSLALSWVMMLMYILAQCPNIEFAGVTVQYGDQFQLIDIGDSNITAACNVNCGCGGSYSPMCGSDDVMYYTACHAGCTSVDDTVSPTEYSNCICIPPEFDSQGIQGKCEHDCKHQQLYFVFTFFILFLTFMIVAPSVTAVLAVVDQGQRSLALGLQSVFYRLLGTVPGPIVFGALIDSSCMVWEYECEGQQTCWLYDNERFSWYMFMVLFMCRAISISFFSSSLFFYKPISEIKVESNNEKPAAVTTISSTVCDKETEIGETN